MAVETVDRERADGFLADAWRRYCDLAGEGAPAWLHEPPSCFRVDGLGEDGLLVVGAGREEPEAMLACGTSGRGRRALVAATSERALREVLLALPRGGCRLLCAGAWVADRASQMFRVEPDPPATRWYATLGSFRAARTRPVRRLERADPAWAFSPPPEATVFSARTGAEPGAVAWSEPGGPGWSSVAGPLDLGAADVDCRLSALSAATEHALQTGLAVLIPPEAVDLDESVLHEVGYRLASSIPVLTVAESAAVEPSAPEVLSKRNPIVDCLRDLERTEGRWERGLFCAEGRTLVARALLDGLPIEHLVYTRQLLASAPGADLLKQAQAAGVECSRASESMVGTLTATRPMPEVLAAVRLHIPEAMSIHTTSRTVLLAGETLHNPNNLGMLIRTADAAGMDAVVVADLIADPLHKHCVRAARGAVGRLPIFRTSDPGAWVANLRDRGFTVVAATGTGSRDLYETPLRPPIAIVVGNEQHGLTRSLLDGCTERVRIPMAPGQDSLNVAVAGAVIVYEYLRQQRAAGIADG
ncbi:MAG TPA: RNA methyltransferase [Candidatus Dormibacteraeota bacterium]|nr:RNA methyltransferase [Candidatus Dormibacteraeota bacterium]